MSMFEIIPPEPVVVSDKLAEKILQFIGSFMHADCSSMAEALFAAVPELKLVDNALTTMETVYNDCLLTQQGISDLDGKNLAADHGQHPGKLPGTDRLRMPAVRLQHGSRRRQRSGRRG